MKIINITGNPFSEYLNNGKTHEAIFAAFDKSELCQLYVRPVANDLIDFDYCESYYCVSDFDVLKRLLLKSKSCGKVTTRLNMGDHDVESDYKKIQNITLGKNKTILSIIRDLLWTTNVWKNKNLKSWLDAQKPELIFIDGGGDCYMYNVALFVSDYLNIPIVSYFTDDYLIYPKSNTIFDKYHHFKLQIKLNIIVSKSKLCYAIGEKMSDEYSRHFGRKFQSIMNSVEILPYMPADNDRKLLHIAYFGSLGLNRGNMIAELAALAKDNFVFDLYTFTNIEASLLEKIHISGINIRKAVKGPDLDAAMYGSDILLHVESDDLENRTFTRLAISTKIPEYLMHGRLVLGYGPEEVASMQILKKYDVGVVISSDISKEDKMKVLIDIQNKMLRREYSERAHEFAIEHFDKKKNARNFKNEILNILQRQ